MAGKEHGVTKLLSCLLPIRQVVKAGNNHPSVFEFICRSQNSAQGAEFQGMGSHFSRRKGVSDSKVERGREDKRSHSFQL